MSFRVGLCQLNGSVGDCNATLKIMRDVVTKEQNQADLFVFPELFVCGYAAPVDQLRALAEPFDGPISQTVRALAKEFNIHIAFGYAELDTTTENEERRYIAAQVVSPEGSIVANYRKAHLYDPVVYKTTEKTVFTPGEKLSSIFQINGVPCSLMICWDIELPESARCLAIQGSQVFIVLTANESILTNEIMVRCRALENNSFAVYVNRVGKDGKFNFCGRSVAYAPNGNVLALCSSSDEDFQVATINVNDADVVNYINKNPLLHDRRPELYPHISTKQ